MLFKDEVVSFKNDYFNFKSVINLGHELFVSNENNFYVVANK